MRRLATLVFCLAIACGGESATQPTVASLAGTWSLHDINGILLPFVLSQAGTTKTEMLSDVVTATAAGTYTQVTQLRTTTNGQVTTSSLSDAGTYTLSGNAVVIRSGDGSTINGTVSANSFTIAAGGVAFEYRRQ
jgi:large exoprotein involved in heme utilization and adhesion